MSSGDLELLSTAHCTLCDEALEALLSMPELRGRPLRVVDIAGNEALVERYGERLPVLRCGAGELDWPFEASDVLALISQDAGGPPLPRGAAS